MILKINSTRGHTGSLLVMDYMQNNKSHYYSLYLTTVGLFEVYVVFSQWKDNQVVDYPVFYFLKCQVVSSSSTPNSPFLG